MKLRKRWIVDAISHPLSASNAFLLLPYGPSIGPSTGPLSALQKPSLCGSTWLARHAEVPTGEQRRPPTEMVWGGGNDHDGGETGIGGLENAAAFTAGEPRRANRVPVR